MSAAVPYIAPWATDFRKYSTQTYPFDLVSSTNRSKSVPTGQWWRIIYMSGAYSADANVSSRGVFLQVVGQLSTELLRLGASVAQPASTTFHYAFGVNLGTVANAPSGTDGWSSVNIPDVLWPALTQFNISVIGFRGTDAFSNVWTLATEVYTEDYQGNIVPVLTPTPLIS